MMQLMTEIKVPKFPTITHGARIMMMGSCFASCMAERLLRLRFAVTSNPFGITYNPVSIANSLLRLASATPYSESELRQNNGLFYSPDHHGSFSSATPEDTLAKINTTFQDAATTIRQTSHFIITLGSSVVYEKENRVWNNCHKLPQRLFTKRRLTVDEVIDALSPIIAQHPESRFILTVSPVRYLADDNAVNKATLLLAVDELVRRHKNVTYFPAYEIMTDELRDYRFYAEDMLHPSAMAEEMIFERFGEAYFTEKTRALNREIEKLAAMQEHRPLHPEGEEYMRFKSKLQQYEETVTDAVARSRNAADDCTIK